VIGEKWQGMARLGKDREGREEREEERERERERERESQDRTQKRCAIPEADVEPR